MVCVLEIDHIFTVGERHCYRSEVSKERQDNLASETNNKLDLTSCPWNHSLFQPRFLTWIRIQRLVVLLLVPFALRRAGFVDRLVCVEMINRCFCCVAGDDEPEPAAASPAGRRTRRYTYMLR